jgi:hypothetical protein
VCVVCGCEKKRKKSERRKSEKVSVCEKVKKKVGVGERGEKRERKKSVCEVERVFVGGERKEEKERVKKSVRKKSV